MLQLRSHAWFWLLCLAVLLLGAWWRGTSFVFPFVICFGICQLAVREMVRRATTAEEACHDEATVQRRETPETPS